MSGIFRPSAGYIGRGVTDQSAVLYMLYQKNSLAVVKSGSMRRPASHTFSPWTRWFDCSQNRISAVSR